MLQNLCVTHSLPTSQTRRYSANAINLPESLPPKRWWIVPSFFTPSMWILAFVRSVSQNPPKTMESGALPRLLSPHMHGPQDHPHPSPRIWRRWWRLMP
jgi:hypothetical protein